MFTHTHVTQDSLTIPEQLKSRQIFVRVAQISVVYVVFCELLFSASFSSYIVVKYCSYICRQTIVELLKKSLFEFPRETDYPFFISCMFTNNRYELSNYYFGTIKIYDMTSY